MVRNFQTYSLHFRATFHSNLDLAAAWLCGGYRFKDCCGRVFFFCLVARFSIPGKDIFSLPLRRVQLCAPPSHLSKPAEEERD